MKSGSCGFCDQPDRFGSSQTGHLIKIKNLRNIQYGHIKLVTGNKKLAMESGLNFFKLISIFFAFNSDFFYQTYSLVWVKVLVKPLLKIIFLNKKLLEIVISESVFLHFHVKKVWPRIENKNFQKKLPNVFSKLGPILWLDHKLTTSANKFKKKTGSYFITI